MKVQTLTSSDLSPHALGLPEKFQKWRPNQEHGIQRMLDGSKRVTVISAPTGWGKSPAIIAAAMATGKRTCILTSTRALQDQILDSFESIGLVDIRGLANYQCDLKPDYSCQEGKAARCPFWGSVACPASQAGMRVASSRLVTTNYAKWTSSNHYQGPLSNFEQLICDESHAAPEAIAQAMQVLLHHHETEEVLHVPFLVGSEAQDFENWKRWAQSARLKCQEAVFEAAKKLEGKDPKPSWVRHYTHMQNLLVRLSTVALASPKEWVVDEIEDGYQFDPIRPARYAERVLFCGVPRIILVSATIRPKTLYMLGISKDKFNFHEYPSEFDPKRCPTYHIPTMQVDHRAEDYSRLYLRIDQILNRRQDRKGLVHTVSWLRANEIVGFSRYGEVMLMNEKGKPASAAIEAFKEAEPPAVLVSPSIGTGYDFPNSTAEYQIITKVPFPDSRSKIVKARQEDDPDYGPYQAMQNIVQMTGRIMRSKEDRGETLIIDNHIQWFRNKYGHFAPPNFHQFYKQTDIIPAPPPKL